MSTNLLQGIAPDGTIKAIAVNEDGSIPVSGSPGGGSGDASAANQLTQIDRLVEIRNRLLLPSLYEQIIKSSDLIKTFSYLDVDSPDERISSISISSEQFAIELVDNYAYDGTPGNYRLVSINRSQQVLGQ